MRAIVLIVAVLLASCATVDYQPYEGRATLYDGDGGTKLTMDGVDFWANGTPPVKYSILGVVTSEIGSGFGDEYMIRSAVAGKVKQVGGNAAIQINNNTSFAGMMRTAPNIYMSLGARQMKFAIVKYVTP